MRKYSEMAVILRYSTSVWGASKTDRETSDEVTTTKKASRRSGRFVKHLLGGECPELKTIQNHVQSFHVWVRANTFPSPVKGEVIVPVEKLVETIRQCKQYEREFTGLVDQFLDKYEEIVEQAKTNLGDLFDHDSYPTKEQLRKKFDFDFNVVPIPEASNFSRKLGVDSFIEALTDDYDRRMDEVFSEGEEHLVGLVRDRLLKLHDALVDYVPEGKGSGAALNRRAFQATLRDLETVQSLNIRKNHDIMKWCGEARRIIEGQPASSFRNNSMIRTHAIQELEELLTEMGVEFKKEEKPQEIENFSDLFAHL